MAEPRPLRAVFSTNNGLFKYKETRKNARPIIRPEYEDDAKALAGRLIDEFPEHCKAMTMQDAHQVENYFDVYDIQTQSHRFLFFVLREIVVKNYENSTARIDEYAKHVKESRAESYERLTLEDTPVDVYTSKEIGSMDPEFLKSVLIKLKQWRFPEGPHQPAASQGPVIVIEPTSSALDLNRRASDPSVSYHLSLANPPRTDISQAQLSAPLMATAPGSSQNQYHSFHQQYLFHDTAMQRRTSPPGEWASQLTYADHPRPSMHPRSPGMPLVTEHEPHGAWMSPRVKQTAWPMPSSTPLIGQVSSETSRRSGSYNDPPPTDWPDQVGFATHHKSIPPSYMAGLPQYPHAPLSQRQQVGFRNPPKRTSDDVRQHNVAMNTQRFTSPSRQAPAVPTKFQPSFVQQPELGWRASSRTSSTGHDNEVPYEARHDWENQHNAFQIQTRGATTSLAGTSFCPRHDSRSTHAETEQQQYSVNIGKPGRPRIGSNQFPPTIFEPPGQKGEATVRSAKAFTSQHLDQYPRSQPGPGFSNHVNPSCYERSDQHLYDQASPVPHSRRGSAIHVHHRAWDHPASDQRIGPMVSQTQTQTNEPPEMDPHAFGREITHPQMHYAFQRHPLTEELSQPSFQIRHFPPHLPDQRRKSYEQPPPKATIQPILYIRGIPNGFDRNAAFDMLKFVRGLLYVTEPKISKPFDGRPTDLHPSWVFASFRNWETADEALRDLPQIPFTALNGRCLEVYKRKLKEDWAFDSRIQGSQYVPGHRSTALRYGQDAQLTEDHYNWDQPPSNYSERLAVAKSPFMGHSGWRGQHPEVFPGNTGPFRGQPRGHPQAQGAIRGHRPNILTSSNEAATPENVAHTQQRKSRSSTLSEGYVQLDGPNALSTGSPAKRKGGNKRKKFPLLVQETRWLPAPTLQIEKADDQSITQEEQIQSLSQTQPVVHVKDMTNMPTDSTDVAEAPGQNTQIESSLVVRKADHMLSKIKASDRTLRDKSIILNTIGVPRILSDTTKTSVVSEMRDMEFALSSTGRDKESAAKGLSTSSAATPPKLTFARSLADRAKDREELSASASVASQQDHAVQASKDQLVADKKENVSAFRQNAATGKTLTATAQQDTNESKRASCETGPALERSQYVVGALQTFVRSYDSKPKSSIHREETAQHPDRPRTGIKTDVLAANQKPPDLHEGTVSPAESAELRAPEAPNSLSLNRGLYMNTSSDPLSKVPDADQKSQPMTLSSSIEGVSSGATSTLTSSAPTTFYPTKRTNSTATQPLATIGKAALKTQQPQFTDIAGGVDPEALRSKLEATRIDSGTLSEINPSPGGTNKQPLGQISQSVSEGNQKGKHSAAAAKALSAAVELKSAGTGDKGLENNSVAKFGGAEPSTMKDFQRQKVKTMVSAKASERNMVLSYSPRVGELHKPSRSSSSPQLPALAPITTRKKKQKKQRDFATATEEQEEREVSAIPKLDKLHEGDEKDGPVSQKHAFQPLPATTDRNADETTTAFASQSKFERPATSRDSSNSDYHTAQDSPAQGNSESPDPSPPTQVRPGGNEVASLKTALGSKSKPIKNKKGRYKKPSARASGGFSHEVTPSSPAAPGSELPIHTRALPALEMPYMPAPEMPYTPAPEATHIPAPETPFRVLSLSERQSNHKESGVGSKQNGPHSSPEPISKVLSTNARLVGYGKASSSQYFDPNVKGLARLLDIVEQNASQKSVSVKASSSASIETLAFSAADQDAPGPAPADNPVNDQSEMIENRDPGSRTGEQKQVQYREIEQQLEVLDEQHDPGSPPQPLSETSELEGLRTLQRLLDTNDEKKRISLQSLSHQNVAERIIKLGIRAHVRHRQADVVGKAVRATLERVEQEAKQPKQVKRLNQADLNATIEVSRPQNTGLPIFGLPRQEFHDIEESGKRSSKSRRISSGTSQSTLKKADDATNLNVLAEDTSSEPRTIRSHRTPAKDDPSTGKVADSFISSTQLINKSMISKSDYSPPLIPNEEILSPLATKGKGKKGVFEGSMSEFSVQGTQTSAAEDIPPPADDSKAEPHFFSPRPRKLSYEIHSGEKGPSVESYAMNAQKPIVSEAIPEGKAVLVAQTPRKLSFSASLVVPDFKNNSISSPKGKDPSTPQRSPKTSSSNIVSSDDKEFPSLKENTEPSPHKLPKISYATAASLPKEGFTGANTANISASLNNSNRSTLNFDMQTGSSTKKQFKDLLKGCTAGTAIDDDDWAIRPGDVLYPASLRELESRTPSRKLSPLEVEGMTPLSPYASPAGPVRKVGLVKESSSGKNAIEEKAGGGGKAVKESSQQTSNQQKATLEKTGTGKDPETKGGPTPKKPSATNEKAGSSKGLDNQPGSSGSPATKGRGGRGCRSGGRGGGGDKGLA